MTEKTLSKTSSASSCTGRNQSHPIKTAGKKLVDKIKSPLEISKHSAALLLAEHERIAALYKHNAEMGDKYVTSYLTIMSLTIALLVGISNFKTLNQENITIEIALMVILFVVGVGIFRRLVQRRIRMIEYLRAINRINHYFASKDNEIM